MGVRNIAAAALHAWWRVRGYRTIRIFGHQYRLAPATEFPIRAVVPFPKGDCRSNIVRYGDLVQFHAASRMISQLHRPPIAIDIGAHHGIYAVVLGKMIQERSGTLLAVEPNAESFAILRENVRLNGLEGTVHCIAAAVMDECGEMQLEANGPQSRVTRSDGIQGNSICVTTLRALLNQYEIEHVDLMQIDVEGAELPVLRGYPWGTIDVDAILCELHPYAWPAFGYDGTAFEAFMAEQKLRCIDTYMIEHTNFSEPDYIGPTRLISADPERPSPNQPASHGAGVEGAAR